MNIDKKVITAVISIVIAVIGYLKTELNYSRNEAAVYKSRLEMVQTIAKNPDVVVKPKTTRTIEIVREVPIYLTDEADEMANKLRELGYKEWIKITEILDGGSETTHDYSPVENIVPDKITPNNSITIAYAIQNSVLCFGYSRRIYKTFEVGGLITRRAGGLNYPMYEEWDYGVTTLIRF